MPPAIQQDRIKEGLATFLCKEPESENFMLYGSCSSTSQLLKSTFEI
jgi:hypothetical protein